MSREWEVVGPLCSPEHRDTTAISSSPRIPWPVKVQTFLQIPLLNYGVSVLNSISTARNPISPSADTNDASKTTMLLQKTFHEASRMFRN